MWYDCHCIYNLIIYIMIRIIYIYIYIMIIVHSMTVDGIVWMYLYGFFLKGKMNVFLCLSGVPEKCKWGKVQTAWPSRDSNATRPQISPTDQCKSSLHLFLHGGWWHGVTKQVFCIVVWQNFPSGEILCWSLLARSHGNQIFRALPSLSPF